MLRLFLGDMKNILQAKELRQTKFRMSVIDIFDKYSYALTQEMVEKELVEFDRITLYRTLKLFVEKGILHEISIPNQDKKYALCVEKCESSTNHQHDHVHFNCTECKQLFCLKIEQYPTISIAKHRVKKIEIQLEGVCENCL